MLRLRPMDATAFLINYNTNRFDLELELIGVGFYIIIKNSIRRLFMMVPTSTSSSS